MRTLPTGLDTALSAAVVAPVFLVELDWPSGTVRCWNGYHDLVWNGFTWTGTGHLGTISDITESADGAANGVQLSLSGIPLAAVSQVLENNSQGRPGIIYHGVLSSTGFVIEPYLIFDGLIDYSAVTRDGGSASITVNLEKELYDDRSNARRWNHEDQQIDFPGDLGFQFVPSIANKQFTWGKATVYPAGSSGAGAGDDNDKGN